ncbi:hypothetical protein SBA1_1240011 [Candidatus Sulfotelmatobacter kueseliae]|uniref:Uncharacterized protein n=1 Tax=Candidatus Sulfotelmatobacter kueseliae TaxID=2042962 RepID=A0A2U3K468_9BACT|nr:hypothetical protein SBA1_1240011 [Candidatus Sulfotelmatobacter kueseliae]
MGTAALGCPAERSSAVPHLYTGTAVFLGGLKNGSVTTSAFVFSRIASIVISICSCVPSLA